MPGKDVILQRIERRQEKGGMVKPVERDTTFPLGFSSQRIPTQEPRLGRYSGHKELRVSDRKHRRVICYEILPADRIFHFTFQELIKT